MNLWTDNSVLKQNNDYDTIFNNFKKVIDNFKPVIFNDISINILLEHLGFKICKNNNNEDIYKYTFHDNRDGGYCVLSINKKEVNLTKYLSDLFEKDSDEIAAVSDGLTISYDNIININIDTILDSINTLLNSIKVDKEAIEEFKEISSISRRLKTNVIEDAIGDNNLDKLQADVLFNEGTYGLDMPLPKGVTKLADDNLLSDLMNIFGGMGIDLDNLNLEEENNNDASESE